MKHPPPIALGTMLLLPALLGACGLFFPTVLDDSADGSSVTDDTGTSEASPGDDAHAEDSAASEASLSDSRPGDGRTDAISPSEGGSTPDASAPPMCEGGPATSCLRIKKCCDTSMFATEVALAVQQESGMSCTALGESCLEAECATALTLTYMGIQVASVCPP